MKIQTVAVFSGSRPGNNELYGKHAKELGRLIATIGIKLIYGGGKNGLMGLVAKSVLENNGKVMGIVTKSLLNWEQQLEGITEMAIVPDMHSRKKMMYELSDAAIVLPGGFGTLDECIEMISWNQLKIHDKRIFFLNSSGFYTQMQQHLRKMESEGFLYEPLNERIMFCSTPVQIFNMI